MPTRTVKIAAFPYSATIESATSHDGTATVRRLARFGDEIELNDADAARGDNLDAFVTEDDLLAAENENTEPADVDLSKLDVLALCAFMKEHGPSARVLIESVGADAEFAERVLEADDAATGGVPRKQLAKAMRKVIADAESTGDDGDE